MPADKSKGAERRTQVKNLRRTEKELSKDEKKQVKGGLLPYIEQDSVYKSTNVIDGTSNTLKEK